MNNSTVIDQLEAKEAASPSTSNEITNQEAKAIKAKFQQLLYSNSLIEGERESKKEVYKALKTDHGIKGKAAKTIEKLLEKGSLTEFNEDQYQIEKFYEIVRQ